MDARLHSSLKISLLHSNTCMVLNVYVKFHPNLFLRVRATAPKRLKSDDHIIEPLELYNYHRSSHNHDTTILLMFVKYTVIIQ